MDLRWARKWVAGKHEPQPLRAAPRRRHDHEELDCAAAAEEQEGSKQRKHAATGSTIAGAGPRPGSTEASTAVPQYKLVLRYQYHGTSLYRGTALRADSRLIVLRAAWYSPCCTYGGGGNQRI